MAKQKIFFDGLGLVDGHFSGVGQYILGILRGIDEILETAKYSQMPVPEVYVLVPRDEIYKFKRFAFKHIGYKPFPIGFRYVAALWHRNKMPPIDLWFGSGVYIFPRFVGMRLAFSPSANVVFDLSYELHREFSDEKNAQFLSKGVKRTIKHSKKVVTISQNAKKEIEEFYKLPSDKVIVATPATDPHAFYRRSKKEIDRVKRKYGIEGNYILALSNLEPRKNLEALVDVYCRLPKHITKDISLLLVGVSGWKTEALFDKIVHRVEKGANIIRPSSYLKDKDKPAIISGARMLVYPSHYEGFGMPPLEALACGVPVIAADNSSLPEVVGTAGLLVPSNDTDKLYGAVFDTLTKDQRYVESVRLAGPARAKQFSWIKSAQTFLSIAEELNQ